MPIDDNILVLPVETENSNYALAIGASTATYLLTQPLELVKIKLQLEQGFHWRMTSLLRTIYRREGFFALYKGLSASVLRHLTLTGGRLLVFNFRKAVTTEKKKSMVFASAVAAIWSVPSDKVKIRMQNELLLPMEKQKNYANVFDGLYQIYRHEGGRALFKGASVTSFRAGLLCAIEIISYDLLKKLLGHMNLLQYTASWVSAGVIAATLTQPLDVIKTRMINSHYDKFRTYREVVDFTAKDGWRGFYKGYVPTILRLVPQTCFALLLYRKAKIAIKETKEWAIVLLDEDDDDDD